MAGNTVVVSITGNAKGLQKALGDSESGLAKFGKVAGAIGIAAGVALGAIGVKAVSSASNLEQALGGMRSVFGDSAGQMEKWAGTAASSVGLAKSEYASLATTLGSQLKNMGVSSDALAGQTNKLVGMGADLAAQFGGSTSDAVSALSSLLRGERDPIERYGVSINEAAVKAKLAEMGLSGLSGEAEKNAKLQATLALLSQQTADAMGAFTRESTTLAGAQQRLSAGTENLYATLGTTLLPAVTAVTAALGALVTRVSESAAFAAFTGYLTNASNAFADFVFGLLNGEATLSGIDFESIFQGLLDGAVTGIQTAANWLATGGAATLVNGLVSGRAAVFNAAFTIFPAILEALVAAIPAIVTGLVALVTQLASMLVVQAPILLAGAVTLFTTLLEAIVTVLPSLLAGIVAILPPVLTTVLEMIPALLDAAILVFTSLVEALPVILPLLINAIVDLLPKILTTVLNMIPKLLDAAIKLFTSLVESLPVILPLLLTAIIKLLPQIISTVLEMIPKLLTSAIKLFTALVTAIPKILPELIPALLGLLPQIIGAIVGMIPKLIQAGVDLIGGLVTGLWNAAGTVGSVLLDIAKDALGDFLSFFGIHSPSRKMAEQGKYLIQGLAGGISKNVRLVDNAMGKLNTRVDSGFSASLSAPEFASAGSGFGASAAPATVINITVNGGLGSPAEIGREITAAIRAYENSGGRL